MVGGGGMGGAQQGSSKSSVSLCAGRSRDSLCMMQQSPSMSAASPGSCRGGYGVLVCCCKQPLGNMPISVLCLC
jgi:hypothetical protein